MIKARNQKESCRLNAFYKIALQISSCCNLSHFMHLPHKIFIPQVKAMLNKDIKIFIDRMGVREQICDPLYDKLISIYGKDNIYAMTEKTDVINRYTGKISEIIDAAPMYGINGDEIRYSCAQKYNAIDSIILTKMSQYQHIIMMAFTRRVKNDNYLYMTNQYYDYLRFWNGYLDEKKVNIVLFEAPPHEFHDMLIYFICKCRNIKTLMFAHVYKGYYILTDDISKFSIEDLWEGNVASNGIEKLDESFTELLYRYSNVNEIPTAEAKPDYYKRTGIISGLSSKRLGLFRRIAYAGLYAFQTIFQTKNLKLIRFLSNQDLQRDYLNIFEEAVQYYDAVSIKPDYDKKYVYVALHYQPEMTTLTFGGYYENQILMVRLLASVVPDNCVLYVKEHPRMFVDFLQYPNARDVRYYQELHSIKNVKLIDRKTNTYELMQHCAFVATVTGTVGIEALFRNKQVIHFGRAPFEGAPGCYRVTTIEECKETVAKILEKSDTYTYDKERVEEWLLRLQNRCVYGGLDNNPSDAVKFYRDDSEKQKYMLEILTDAIENGH